MRAGAKIYNLIPNACATIDRWPDRLRQIRQLDFNVVAVSAFYEAGASGHPMSIRNPRRLAPHLVPSDGAEATSCGCPTDEAMRVERDSALLRSFVREAAALGLAVMVDLVTTHTSRDAPLIDHHREWFGINSLGEIRRGTGAFGGDTAALDWEGRHQSEIAGYFGELIKFYADLGIRGFRCINAAAVPAHIWRDLIAAARAENPSVFFVADTLGRPVAESLHLKSAKFDYIYNSVKWWDGRGAWFVEQEAELRKVAPTIGFPESINSARLVTELGIDAEDSGRLIQEYKRRYAIAALLSCAIEMPQGYEAISSSWQGGSEDRVSPVLVSDSVSAELRAFISHINHLKEEPALSVRGEDLRSMGHPQDSVQCYVIRSNDGEDSNFVVINTDDRQSYPIDLDWLYAGWKETIDLIDLTAGKENTPLLPYVTLAASEVRLYQARVVGETRETETPAAPRAEAIAPPRVVIEHPRPAVDHGKFAVKRVVGDRLEIAADIFRDGHDQIAAAIRLQEAGDAGWRLAPLRFFDNDEWRGGITLRQEGVARYTVEAWTDHFASWSAEVNKKRAAGQTIKLELIEGIHLVEAAVRRAEGEGASAHIVDRLKAVLQRLQEVEDAARADLLLSAFVAHAMAVIPDKTDRLIYEPVIPLQIDRPQARFAAWYEMFPRSQGTEPDRPATFADCEKRLPEIRDLGFDVVYLVPIHPIGKTNRKGRDNSLIALPGDPGSPYAIGNEFGGHDAVDPELGTIDDFRRFQKAVRDHGMELALDFAVQCSPDHPWLKQHPSWFKKRPDGTIKFAENPPKKYEDIVNVDFDSPDWKALWEALRDVVLFWVGEGVKIFRVDNPHTKPVAFWQWLIASVKEQDPDVLFLAEAFTKPKMMGRLAKVGFTQSYSYFTWRNSKDELIEYLTELTQGKTRDYYQPNFFPNTPDILPVFLQEGGRAAFRIRLVLAATLSPVYGLYNGYELCEAAPVPGKEEYLHSEKYQYKVWDWDRPGNIKDDIRRLNHLRQASPALQQFTNLSFHQSTHPNILFYSKRAPDADGQMDLVLVAVNLDPFATASGEIALPLEQMGLDEGGSIDFEELFTDRHGRWTGRRHFITLDPTVQPALVLRRARA